MLEHIYNEPKTPSRVVILGAKGFVGSTTVSLLESQGVNVLDLGSEDLNLLDEGAGDKLATILEPGDSLLIVSAKAPVKNNAMLESNIAMMSSVCKALETVSPAHIVYVSSDAVYADSTSPLNEASCAQPDSLHGVMHLAREVMLKNAYEGPLAIVRPTLLYGSNDPHNGYGPNRFRRLAAAGEEIILFGEGEERRDHVLIDDVAELIFRVLTHQSKGILNIVTGDVMSFRDIAELVVEQFDKPVAIKGSLRIGAMPHDGYRPFDSLETTKAFPDFKYSSLKDGLAKTHEDINSSKSG